ncbi:MAG: ribosome rescue protein RqcH [Methanobacteriaceae archaeon]|nr:ribosome rescue protein RqcH [Methanobacteriaceae archaeon]
MKAMSNVDIFTICQELNDLLVGSRVDKSFQPTKDTIVMRFHKAGIGRLDLVMQAGARVHISQYPLANPQNPPHFPMLLRKRVKGANVISVEQHNFDRVLVIKMQKEQVYTLIVELFAQGNIILVDEENNIITPLKRKHWSDRDISAKREYFFPESKGINPIEITKEEFETLIKETDSEIVKALARNGLGSLYSEEIIGNTDIDKRTNCQDLSEEDIEALFKSLKDLFNKLTNKEFNPAIVSNKKEIEELNNENPDKKYKIKEDVVPIDLKQYENFDKTEYKTFNEACDEFYSSKVKNEITNIQEAIWNKKVGKFSKRLEKQTETVNGFKNTIESSQKKTELIYTYYGKIDNLLNVILNARTKDYGWKEIAKILKQAKKDGMEEAQIYESLDPLGNITLKIEDTSINLDCKKSINDNAEIYFEKSKKAKRKIKGAEIAIENTKKQLAEMEAKKEKAMENIMTPQKRVKKNLKWYEKLRWFISSDGTLVVGGRDAGTNENVVKKYLDKNDLYMHADIHGAPSVAIKIGGNEANENLLKESAIFAASFSSAWSKSYGTQDVYWVNPEQVSKTPESGEFVPKGAFIVRGHRNYVRSARLEIAIGIIEYDGAKRVMAGPIDAMKAYTNKYVSIKPGYTKKEAIAKQILAKINEDNLLTLEDIIRILPSGKCDFI